MKNSFHKIFWGFIFVLLEIHILVVDIFPDPVGYFLICSGVKLLADETTYSKKAINLAVALVIISIPTVFIQQNINLNQVGQSATLINGWTIYTTILTVLKLVLVFYIFKIMENIAKARNDDALFNRTSKTFTIYMTIMLIITILQPFTMNLTEEWSGGFFIISSLIGLIMEITFLVLLRKFMKLEENEDNDSPLEPIKDFETDV